MADKTEDFLRELTELSRKYQLAICLEGIYGDETPTIELYEMEPGDAERTYALDGRGALLFD